MFKEFARVYARYALLPVLAMGLIGFLAAFNDAAWLVIPALIAQVGFLIVQLVTQIYCVRTGTY